MFFWFFLCVNILLTPINDGQVTVQLPAGKVRDNTSNENLASNLLSVNYEKEEEDDDFDSLPSLMNLKKAASKYK